MKKFLCFIAVIALIVGAFVFAPDIRQYADDYIAAKTSVDWEEYSAEPSALGSKYKNHFESLSENQKKAYSNILGAVLNSEEQFPDEIEVPMMTGDELTAVFEAVIYDNPTMSCFGTNCSIITRGELCYFKPDYIMTVVEFKQKTAELDAKAAEILTEIPSGADEYEKELFIHDYIISNCTYDNSRLQNASMIYSCLIDGSAACEGYAKSAKYLLEKAGIECYTVVGKARNKNGESENHMWNIVGIGGGYYHLDLTWDDPSGEKETLSHTYMNLTEQEIMLDHFDFDSEFECTATQANYFKMSGLLFDSFNSDDYKLLQKKLAQNALSSKNRIEIRFTSDEAFDSGYERLIEKGAAYYLAKNINRQYGTDLSEKNIEYTKDENFRVIELIFE